MRLIVVIIQDRDADAVISALTAVGQRVTRVGTTGGLLQQGLSTLLIGASDDAVPEVITTIQKHSRRRAMFMPLGVGIGDPVYALSEQVEVEIGGSTIFVFDVDQFTQI